MLTANNTRWLATANYRSKYMSYTDFLPLLSALGGLIMLLMLLFQIKKRLKRKNKV